MIGRQFRMPNLKPSPDPVALTPGPDPKRPCGQLVVIWQADGTGRGEFGQIMAAWKLNGATRYMPLDENTGLPW
jgi:hypothetical protein